MAVKVGLKALYEELSSIRRDEGAEIRLKEEVCESVDLLGLPDYGFERKMRIVLHFVNDAEDHVSAALDEVIAALGD